MVANLFRTTPRWRTGTLGTSPRHIDGSTGRKYRYPVFGKFFFRHVTPTDRPLSCSFCISSGCLIPKRAFESAGLFQEEYFVYAVDTEFCRRVLRHGYSIFISEKATLVHREGGGRQADLGIFQLRTPDWSASSLYYIFRNVIYDLRTNPVFSWRIHEGLFLARACSRCFSRIPWTGRPAGRRSAEEFPTGSRGGWENRWSIDQGRGNRPTR